MPEPAGDLAECIGCGAAFPTDAALLAHIRCCAWHPLRPDFTRLRALEAAVRQAVAARRAVEAERDALQAALATAEQRAAQAAAALRRYGGHRVGCAWRAPVPGYTGDPTPPPPPPRPCTCGWPRVEAALDDGE